MAPAEPAGGGARRRPGATQKSRQTPDRIVQARSGGDDIAYQSAHHSDRGGDAPGERGAQSLGPEQDYEGLQLYDLCVPPRRTGFKVGYAGIRHCRRLFHPAERALKLLGLPGRRTL